MQIVKQAQAVARIDRAIKRLEGRRGVLITQAIKKWGNARFSEAYEKEKREV